MLIRKGRSLSLSVASPSRHGSAEWGEIAIKGYGTHGAMIAPRLEQGASWLRWPPGLDAHGRSRKRERERESARGRRVLIHSVVFKGSRRRRGEVRPTLPLSPSRLSSPPSAVRPTRPPPMQLNGESRRRMPPSPPPPPPPPSPSRTRRTSRPTEVTGRPTGRPRGRMRAPAPCSAVQCLIVAVAVRWADGRKDGLHV